jgi:AcrR family transcriptional regulator
MPDRSTTRERILAVSRRLFNERGYAATPLAEVAASVDIAKGNLTDHFPIKYDLVVELVRPPEPGVRSTCSCAFRLDGEPFLDRPPGSGRGHRRGDLARSGARYTASISRLVPLPDGAPARRGFESALARLAAHHATVDLDFERGDSKRRG